MKSQNQVFADYHNDTKKLNFNENVKSGGITFVGGQLIATSKGYDDLVKENERLKEELQARKDIQKAKITLMKKYKISEQEAFRAIQKKSMDSQIPMKEIAKSIILTNEILN